MGLRQTSAEEEAFVRSRDVLGYIVHERALERLHELWPLAAVRIQHTDGARDGVRSKVTRVQIVPSQDRRDWSTASVPMALGEARCRLDEDDWDRRRGIDLAFRRALEHVKTFVPDEY